MAQGRYSSLYQLVRRFCPRKPKVAKVARYSFRMRRETSFLTARQSLQSLLHHCGHRFAAAKWQPPSQPLETSLNISGSAVHCQKAGKAVPPNSAPIEACKLAADVLAPHAVLAVEECWGAGQVGDGFLAWLPSHTNRPAVPAC